MSSFGPSWPIPVPNRGADTQTDGDQEGSAHQEGSTYGTASGMQTRYDEKPRHGDPLRDLYIWEEDLS